MIPYITKRLPALSLCFALTMTLLVSGTAIANNRTTPLGQARQLVLVTADDWQSTTATLRRFERSSVNQAWVAVAPPVAVNLGRNGLAWGLGLHPGKHQREPSKREGDGRSPAGVFRLSAVFGDANAVPAIDNSAKLPYWPVTIDLKCVDDSASPHYNQIVDTRQGISVDGLSYEEMKRDDEQYSVGVVVAHNATPPVAGAGSCIFIHVWRAPGAPTAGCTSGARDDLVKLFSWLDEARQPVLVQLPEREYQRYRSRWALPR